jgi:hypothetical protein
VAATAAGVAWPEQIDTQGAQPPDLVYRCSTSTMSLNSCTGCDLQAWPTDDTAGESLNMLSISVGTPFHWRHQIPIFRFSTDLDCIDPSACDPVRL